MQVGNQNSVIGYQVRYKQAKIDRPSQPVSLEFTSVQKQTGTNLVKFIKNHLPQKTTGNSWTKKIEDMADFPSWVERLMYGATAICSQPFIEHFDKNVDKETKKSSIPRICAKILAGTSVGVATRWSASWVGEKLAAHKIINANPKSLAYVISIVATVGTIFTIDAPATKFIMNNIKPVTNTIMKVLNPPKSKNDVKEELK